MTSFFSSPSHTRNKSSLSITGSPKKKSRDATSSSWTSQMSAPTIKELNFGSSIGARTAAVTAFKEFGPPDLVHLSRFSKHLQRDEGEYHFVTGVDLSSSDAPLAYITTWSMKHPWIASKHSGTFTYCSYNAFSRCDVRIRTEVKDQKALDPVYQVIPGDRSQRILNEVSEELWDELYVTAVVRSIIIAQDIERKLPALAENLPFQSVSAAKETIARLVKFLDRGAFVGASSDVQKPSIYENFLVDTLFTIIELTGLYEYAIDQIEKLETKHDYEVLIIKILFKSDKEIEAIQRTYHALKKNPRNSLLMVEQIKFLIQKSEFENALEVALHCVMVDPISFNPWYYLIKSQILNDKVTDALVSLNSAPMYSLRQKDLALVNTKDEISLPFPQYGKVKSVWETDLVQVQGQNSENQIKFSPKSHVEAADPSLLRINKRPLKGTYEKAYELLVLIVSRVGWDGLLRMRSQVFLMDEEYRNGSVVSINSEGQESDLKQKRLCERWLDELFLQVYDDLRVVLIVENELSKENQLKHSALEWELIGLTAYRTAHYKSAVSSLRTTITAKFDVISAYHLLDLWNNQVFNTEFQIWAKLNKDASVDISLDDILRVLVQTISYNVRFYDESQLKVLLFLKNLLTQFDVDYIKNKVQVLFENDNNDYSNSGVIPAFDRLAATVQYLVSVP